MMDIISQDIIKRAIEKTKQDMMRKDYKLEEKGEKKNGVVEKEEIKDGDRNIKEENIEELYVIQDIEPGKIVSGIVEKIDKEEVFVSIQGAKSEGIIPRNELSTRQFSSPEEIVKVGDKIRVYIVEMSDREGIPILSKRKADIEDTWDRLIKAYETGEILVGKVVNKTRGGLIVNLGIYGFIPFSQIETNTPKSLNYYLGKTLRVKIIEINREDNNLICSHKVVLEEEQMKKKQELLNKICEGMMCEGVVSKITSFGAFVDIGGIDGLVHLSEISWNRIKHPKDVLRKNEKVKVVVLKVDKDAEKISLSIKQAKVDPWKEIEEKYKVGNVVSGKITKLTNSAAFVRLDEGIEGILPLKEMALKKVSSPTEVVREGEKITAKIIDIRLSQRRIVLSIKAILQAAEEDAIKKYLKNQNSRTLGMTLGDMFKDKFEKLINEQKEQS
jgi:4-hydroxy-3-methylbut-2-enyl diphosphate reductase